MANQYFFHLRISSTIIMTIGKIELINKKVVINFFKYFVKKTDQLFCVFNY